MSRYEANLGSRIKPVAKKFARFSSRRDRPSKYPSANLTTRRVTAQAATLIEKNLAVSGPDAQPRRILNVHLRFRK